MRLVRLLPALLSLVPAFPALAQTPIITPTALQEASKRINLEDYNSDDFKVDLMWTVSLASRETFEYQLTYNRGATEDTTATELCVDETIVGNDARAPVEPTARVTVSAAQIVDDETCPPRDIAPAFDRETRNIVLRVYRAADPFDELTSATYTWTFEIDTQPPPAPTATAALPGENRVQVQWAPPATEIDVLQYQVLYCLGAATSSTALPCDDPRIEGEIAKTQTSFAVEDGVTNGAPVSVAVRAVDELGNLGPISNVLTATPSPVLDFFEYYRSENGPEDGGFCFIATAAYGSYAHPAVRVLRAFRDGVLKRTPLGTLAVWAYYHASPPLAEALRARPGLKTVVRAALVPVALAALLLLLAPLGGALWLVRMLLRRGRASRALGAGVLALALTAAAGPARAESSRPKSDLTTVGLGLELKGGPYFPRLAEGRSGPDETFAAVFSKGGEPPGARPLYSVGLDLQLFRAFGTAGIGGSFGFMQYVGKARYPNDGGASFDTTVFNLMPLTLTASYRFDWLADQASVPFVPYARGGLAYHVWWVTTGTGDISKYEGGEGSADDLTGRGGKLGLTGTVGIAFLLNVIEPFAARNLFEATSIRGTYIFAEYQVNKVDGFGAEGFDLSDSTWNLGLYLEL